MIDDRFEDARRETISRNYTTMNIWPTCFSEPLVKPGSKSELQDHYFIKAMVPISKSRYEQEFKSVGEKPKFKLIEGPTPMRDPVIFGVLTAKNYMGQIPPVQICDQDFESCQTFLTNPTENLDKNESYYYSFEDVTSAMQTNPIDSEKIMKHLRDKTYDAGWLEAYDSTDEREFQIDLKELGLDITDVLQFNQLLFRHISNKAELNLTLDGDHKKNYLLVPLSLMPGGALRYRVDTTLIH